MTTAKTTIIAISLCMCSTMATVAADESAIGVSQHSFAIPQHGVLTLRVPDTWKQDVNQPPGDLPPTITFSPAEGDEFVVLITPLWSPANNPAHNNPEKVKNLIDDDLKGMLPGAVEQQVDVQEFKGVDGTGYYFLVTDKAPKPGEYLYAVRAGIGVGDLLLSVTVLSRSKSSEGITATIKALMEARQVYE